MNEAGSITVRVPLTVRRRPGRKTVVVPNGEEGAPVRVRADPALVKALARASRWQRMLDDRRYGSISELARAEKIERGYLGQMLQLTLLAPHVVERILGGRCFDELSLHEDGVNLFGASKEADSAPYLSIPQAYRRATIAINRFDSSKPLPKWVSPCRIGQIR